jgi:LPS-assembly protein
MKSPVQAAERIRHSIKPRVVYDYIPSQDQSDLPSFTDLDRIEESNRVTYSLTNLFTARTVTGNRGISNRNERNDPSTMETPPKAAPVATSEPASYDYHRFCRFYLEQSYDIDAEKEDDPEPFSDVFGELDLNFGRYLAFDSDGRYDVYDNNFSSHNVAATISDRRGDQLWLEHSYRRDDQESINTGISIKLTNRLTVRGRYERNLLDDRDILKGGGFLYTAQCWSVDFFYAKEGTDNKFAFSINLMGIGGFGN